MLKILFPLFSSLFLLSVISCNLYAPFNTYGSDVDFIEEGTKCLHNNDYDCAAREFAKISDQTKKSQKLCTVNLARAGFTISALLGTVNGGGNDMLVKLATALIPWTETKSSAADDAKTNCGTFASLTTNPDLGALLKSTSLIVHCSNRVSKTDLYLGTSETDETCTTAGNGDGKLTATDVSAVSDGAIAPKGMCAKDVIACREDISTLSSVSFSGSSLSGIGDAFASMPSDLKNSSAGVQLVRSSIRGMF